jgi:hypothetical protein
VKYEAFGFIHSLIHGRRNVAELHNEILRRIKRDLVKGGRFLQKSDRFAECTVLLANPVCILLRSRRGRVTVLELNFCGHVVSSFRLPQEAVLSGIRAHKPQSST